MLSLLPHHINFLDQLFLIPLQKAYNLHTPLQCLDFTWFSTTVERDEFVLEFSEGILDDGASLLFGEDMDLALGFGIEFGLFA